MGLRIIYIDDSETSLLSVKRALGRAGHEVLTYTGAADLGLELLRADLVLIDYHLPGRSGPQVLVDIRRTWNLHEPSPYFYLYTSDRGVGAHYRSLGFDGHFILKGNLKALVCQVSGAERSIGLRSQRPNV